MTQRRRDFEEKAWGLGSFAYASMHVLRARYVCEHLRPIRGHLLSSQIDCPGGAAAVAGCKVHRGATNPNSTAPVKALG